MEQIEEGTQKNKKRSLNRKNSSGIPRTYDAEDYGWLKRNIDRPPSPQKISRNIQPAKVNGGKKKAWKKLRGTEDQDRCGLYGFQRETVQHLLAGCNKVAGKEYIRKLNNALMF